MTADERKAVGALLHHPVDVGPADAARGDPYQRLAVGRHRDGYVLDVDVSWTVQHRCGHLGHEFLRNL